MSKAKSTKSLSQNRRGLSQFSRYSAQNGTVPIACDGSGIGSKKPARPRAKKSWREKLLDDKDLPRVERIDPAKTPRWGRGTFVIAAPREVDAAMRKIPRGKLTTIDAIRKALAKKHGATIACPLTTGIFAWIAAHAADEAETDGATRITSYWRTLKTGGELNPKYPGGVEAQRRRLEAEGHRVVPRGQRWFVEDFARRVVEPKL